MSHDFATARMAQRELDIEKKHGKVAGEDDDDPPAGRRTPPVDDRQKQRRDRIAVATPVTGDEREHQRDRGEEQAVQPREPRLVRHAAGRFVPFRRSRRELGDGAAEQRIERDGLHALH